MVNHLQLLGLPVLNGAPAIGLARNKMRVLQLLSASGVEVPRTVMASEPSGLREMVRHVGGLPVLVKLLRGNERTGVIVCETRQALESALEAILRLGQNTMVQQYVRGTAGRGPPRLRGGRARGGGPAPAAAGGAPLAQPRARARASRRAVLDADAEQAAAVAAARVVGLEVCAVDMLDAPGGPRVFEVHSSPGIREAEEACGVDLAGAIVERAAEVAGVAGGGPAPPAPGGRARRRP